MEDDAIRFEAESWFSSQWLGGVERVDGASLPHGWESISYDDSNWGKDIPLPRSTAEFRVTDPVAINKKETSHFCMKRKNVY